MTDDIELHAYGHPPIVEAIIGITFEDRIGEEQFASLRKKYQLFYPQFQLVENLNLKVAVEVGADKKKTANTDVQQENGHRFASADMTELLLVLPNSIIISQLAPYPGWDDFFSRFVRDLGNQKRILGYRPIRRIGVRYINRIDIPCEGSVVNHEEYLRVFPQVPDEYGPLNAYVVQAEVFMDDLQCKLVINSAAVPSPMLNTASFLVDQDIAREIDVPQREEEIVKLLNDIRLRKNKVFESCVTDKARELFNL